MAERRKNDIPAASEHPPLEETEREAIERELESFTTAVAEKMRLADDRYRQAVAAVSKAEGEALDPMSDPAVRGAYLELQALQGELEAAADEANRIAASIRSQTG